MQQIQHHWKHLRLPRNEINKQTDKATKVYLILLAVEEVSGQIKARKIKSEPYLLARRVDWGMV
jgi:hypothetical protein